MNDVEDRSLLASPVRTKVSLNAGEEKSPSKTPRKRQDRSSSMLDKSPTPGTYVEMKTALVDRNPEQVPVDMSQRGSVLYYRGEDSTMYKARYADSPSQMGSISETGVLKVDQPAIALTTSGQLQSQPAPTPHSHTPLSASQLPSLPARMPPELAQSNSAPTAGVQGQPAPVVDPPPFRRTSWHPMPTTAFHQGFQPSQTQYGSERPLYGQPIQVQPVAPMSQGPIGVGSMGVAPISEPPEGVPATSQGLYAQQKSTEMVFNGANQGIPSQLTVRTQNTVAQHGLGSHKQQDELQQRMAAGNLTSPPQPRLESQSSFVPPNRQASEGQMYATQVSMAPAGAEQSRKLHASPQALPQSTQPEQPQQVLTRRSLQATVVGPSVGSVDGQAQTSASVGKYPFFSQVPSQLKG